MIFKLNTFLLTILLALSLAGCGETEQPAPPEPATESATDTGSTAEPAADAADTSMEDSASADAGAGMDASEPAASEPETAASEASDAGGEATTHTVVARATAFDPVAIRIQPGDTVTWTNMAGHNSHTYDDLIPEGAEGWLTPLGQDASVTLDVEGVYIYKCDPHVAMGMVGAIIVGEPTNMAEIEANAQGMARRAVVKAKQAIE